MSTRAAQRAIWPAVLVSSAAASRHLPRRPDRHGTDTTVVVISGFGRTFRENGDRGTDHGHGSLYWVLGGSVKGGRIVGDQIKVEQKTLFQNRDYPVLSEYRTVLGGLFRRIYGLGDERLQNIFPTVRPKDLTLV
jgi:uncharacterized protein (DUF1501 family)